MAEFLVIVESSAKAKTIERYLGNKYKVKASMGHVRDLPRSQMGVNAENGFELKAFYIYETLYLLFPPIQPGLCFIRVLIINIDFNQKFTFQLTILV